jgi:hypothetical protein
LYARQIDFFQNALHSGFDLIDMVEHRGVRTGGVA